MKQVAPRWWEAEPGIQRRLAGVFEGGGAKGVAYAGALRGVLESGAWFSAVAGTSAGAITAALIAAGCHPDELEHVTTSGLRTMAEQMPQSATGWNRWKLLRRNLARLRDTGAFFGQEGLDEWLEGILREAIDRHADETGRVTFQDLFERTNIELNVVAADVSMGRQVVFNAHWTPQASVTDAVRASSAIPGAFLRGDLLVPDGLDTGRDIVHTIVDGGVWSNFPMFVFEDDAYQRWQDEAMAAHAHPETETPRRPSFDHLVGFMLDEEASKELAYPAYERARFAEPASDDVPTAPAREWQHSPVHATSEPSRRSVMSRTGSLLLAGVAAPIELARWIVDRNTGLPRGRWPIPQHPAARSLLGIVDGSMAAFRPLGFRLLAALLVIGGTWQAMRIAVLWPTGDLVDSGFRSLPAWGGTVLGIVVAAGLFLMAMAVLLFLAVGPHVVVAVRTMAYGVARTYFAGPGAPPWASRKANVIALPIPSELGTLTFNEGASARDKQIRDARERAIRDAYNAVTESLPKIMFSMSGK
jgi:predicted acylesterase/phospholipase RssA